MSGGRRFDDRGDPGTDLRGSDEERQRDLGGSGLRRVVVDELGLAGLELDEHTAERRCHDGFHQRAMIVDTKRLAISPASFGLAPRCRATA